VEKIIFTGGGSGGHVMPAITLIKKIQATTEWQVSYVGGRDSIERSLIAEYDVCYKPITTGKLRRYFSFQNFIDIFKVGIGLVQSFFYFLFKSPRTLVFATGGFVSVPVVIAAKLTGKKVFIHEQTSRVGLANKICSKFADKIFVSFEESLNYFPKNKSFHFGYPLRDECYEREIHRSHFKDFSLKEEKPLLFLTGGGNGSLLLNNLVKNDLDELLKSYRVIHQVGKAFISEFEALGSTDYLPVAFVGSEIIDIMKSAEIIISRAGAGTVCELMALKKRSVLIPLKIAQKNEQFHNAMEAKNKLNSLVLSEDELAELSILKVIGKFSKTSKEEQQYDFPNGTEQILKAIKAVLE